MPDTKQITDLNPRSVGERERQQPRLKTKKAQLIAMLGKRHSADITTLSECLGWQKHTIRAALSRLRKAGYELTTEQRANGKATPYRIAASPPPMSIVQLGTATNA